MAKAVSDLTQQFLPVPPCRPPLPLSAQQDDIKFQTNPMNTAGFELSVVYWTFHYLLSGATKYQARERKKADGLLRSQGLTSENSLAWSNLAKRRSSPEREAVECQENYLSFLVTSWGRLFLHRIEDRDTDHTSTTRVWTALSGFPPFWQGRGLQYLIDSEI